MSESVAQNTLNHSIIQLFYQKNMTISIDTKKPHKFHFKVISLVLCRWMYLDSTTEAAMFEAIRGH